MDRHALRAIVNGAVHGDSALVSADQLMAASRRDHPLMSVSAEPPGSQGYLFHNRLIPETSAGRRRTAIRPGDRPGRMAVPCRNAAHRRTRQRRITRRFPNATVRTHRTLHHYNVLVWRPKDDAQQQESPAQYFKIAPCRIVAAAIARGSWCPRRADHTVRGGRSPVLRLAGPSLPARCWAGW